MPREPEGRYAPPDVPTPKQAFCPHCGQRAPIRLDGINAFCTACGGKRRPFETTTLNLAGTGYKVGGIAATVVGTMAMIGGLALAAFLFFLFGWLFPGTLAPYILAVPTLIMSFAFGITALIGGRKLGKYGAQKLETARGDTVRALANHHGGAVTAVQVAETLDITEVQADAMLTAMAKDPDGDVTLDLDDRGRIHYLFGIGGQALQEARWRVATPQPSPSDGPTAEEIAEAEAELEAELHGSPQRRER